MHYVGLCKRIGRFAISLQIESGSQEARNLRDFVSILNVRFSAITVCNRQSKI
jgi:hypothetical protein